MTAESFYRRAAFLPVAVPIAALALLLLLVTIGEPAEQLASAIDDAAGFLVIAGIASLVPYALFVVVALAIGAFTTWGLLALGVGYFYAILINSGLLVAKSLGVVRSAGAQDREYAGGAAEDSAGR